MGWRRRLVQPKPFQPPLSEPCVGSALTRPADGIHVVAVTFGVERTVLERRSTSG